MHGRLAIAVAVALMVALAPSEGTGQWVPRLDDLSASMGGAYEGSWLDNRGERPITAQTLQEWIRLTLLGHIRDPRLFSFRIVARPLFQQGEFLPASDSVSSDGRGDGLLGALNLQFLRAFPISGGFRVQRSTDFRKTRQGGSVEEDLSEWSAEIRDSNPLLPTVFSYESERRKTAWTSGPTRNLLATDQSIRALRLRADNSRTHLLLERLSLDQQTVNTKYVRRLGRLVHTLGWGHGSSLRSHIRYLDRDGLSPFRTITWREAAHLVQSPTITTDLSTGFTRTSGTGTSTTQLDLRGSVVRDAGEGLVLAADGQLQAWRAGVVRRRFLQVGPRGSFLRTVMPGLRLRVDASFLFETHAQGSDGEALADVVQEAHVLGPLGQFELSRPFVDPGSIVLTSEDGGTLFEENFDYRIVDNSPFTSVVPLPGGRFEDEQRVLVDYRYQVAPKVAARSTTYAVDAIVDYRSIQVFHNRRIQNDLDDIPPEVLPVLRNYDRRATGLRWAFAVARATASLSVERRRQRTDRFDYRDDQLTVNVTYRVLPRMFVTGTVRRVRLLGGENPYETDQYDFAADWRATPQVRIRLYSSVWNRVETVVLENVRNVGALLDWRARAHKVSLQVDRTNWVGGFDRDENRISLRFSRRF